jgi:hypothetical protein
MQVPVWSGDGECASVRGRAGATRMHARSKSTEDIHRILRTPAVPAFPLFFSLFRLEQCLEKLLSKAALAGLLKRFEPRSSLVDEFDPGCLVIESFLVSRDSHCRLFCAYCIVYWN